MERRQVTHRHLGVIDRERGPISGPCVTQVLEQQYECAALRVDLRGEARRYRDARVAAEVPVELHLARVRPHPVHQRADRRIRRRELRDQRARCALLVAVIRQRYPRDGAGRALCLGQVRGVSDHARVAERSGLAEPRRQPRVAQLLGALRDRSCGYPHAIAPPVLLRNHTMCELGATRAERPLIAARLSSRAR